MTETIEANGETSKRAQWEKRIAEQASSGKAARDYCREHELSEASFYAWRRRLQMGSWKAQPGKKKASPVRFALVERNTPAVTKARPVGEPTSLEVVLANGARLRIGAGVDPDTLRTVLAALRG